VLSRGLGFVVADNRGGPGCEHATLPYCNPVAVLISSAFGWNLGPHNESGGLLMRLLGIGSAFRQHY
jgi:hypothetical protein